jgi:glycosyltransferase involved in cell wall biosynthesis
MVAYHFPPLAGSSGIQRTLRFVQHLPAFGWEPSVLSANPRAYERTSRDQEADVPAQTIVQRAFALDAARHFSVAGRYPGFLARPDRWASWRLDGLRQGLRMINIYRPQVIWSTYPIATAHMIGFELHRRTGLPWVADFRDPMAQEGFPRDPKTWAAYDRIERQAIERAAVCVFTTPSAAQMYRKRYPGAADRMRVVENGFDEESFARVEATLEARPSAAGRECLTLLHSGIVYPRERDPTQLFVALQQLSQAGRLMPGSLKICFRAAVHEGMLNELAARYGVQSFVSVVPPIPYREALEEMLGADGLLVMQSASCNAQIPAKIYEYLRANRPILALTDPRGDTASVLRSAGIGTIAPFNDSSPIAHSLIDFLEALRECRASLPMPECVRQASRAGRSEQLAEILDGLI